MPFRSILLLDASTTSISHDSLHRFLDFKSTTRPRRLHTFEREEQYEDTIRSRRCLFLARRKNQHNTSSRSHDTFDASLLEASRTKILLRASSRCPFAPHKPQVEPMKQYPLSTNFPSTGDQTPGYPELLFSTPQRTTPDFRLSKYK